MKKALEEDPNVFEYDDVYDDIKSSKGAAGTSGKEVKPRYMENLMKSAESRKREKERREEKKIQKEREAEGDLFGDKDSFVTSAYKQKLIELQEAEEREAREKKSEELFDARKQQDMSGFYRHFLNQTTGEEKIQGSSSASDRFESDKTASTFSKKKGTSKKNIRSRQEESSDEEEVQKDETTVTQDEDGKESQKDVPPDQPKQDSSAHPSVEVPVTSGPESQGKTDGDELKENQTPLVKVQVDRRTLILEKFRKRTVGEAFEAAVQRYKDRKRGLIS